MFLHSLALYFIWFVLYSVFGWVYESIYCSITHRKLINRGFLNGPYCPIYGTGAVAMIAILGSVESATALFMSGAVLACTIEYITSYVMEKLFYARWWDYSNTKFNLNGRICLAGAIVFGAFAVVLIKFIHPFVARLTSFLPPWGIYTAAAVLAVILIADTAVTVVGITGMSEKLLEISEYIERKRKEAEAVLSRERFSSFREHIHTYMKEKLNYQQIRMIKSFPRLKSVKYEKALEDIKEFVEKIKERKNNR